MEPQIEQMQGTIPEDAGRGGDTVLAHLSLGELVIPRAFLDDPQVMEVMKALFDEAGVNINQYIVGDEANSINPETGYPEFGFFKSFKRLFRTLAPLALSYFAPGLGTSIGTGLGLTTGASTIGNALIGGGIGALSGGGLRGALTGAAAGGLGANIGSLGGNAQGPTQSGAPLGGTTGQSGILGAFGKATGLTNNMLPSIGGITGNVGGGGASSFSPINAISSAFGGLSQNEAIKKQREQLLAANNKSLANLESFDPSGITSDPGYKFNLEQGQKGLNTGLAAGGSLFSGKALKAASKYNQDYANNAFNDYYQRWLTKVGGQNQLYGASGDIKANATGARSQNIAQTLSNAFGSQVGQYGGLTLQQLRALGLA